MRFYQISFLLLSIIFLLTPMALPARKPTKWLCVYFHVPVEKLLATKAELLVLDPDAYSADEISALRHHEKTVLAYISVGEAEAYRSFYAKVASSGLVLDENPDWQANFAVKFWAKPWQEILQNYTSEILNKGFNGLFMDVVDAWQLFPEELQQARRQEMEQLVAELCRHARSIRSNAVVFVQNCHQLFENPELMGLLNGINQESLYASWATAEVDKTWQKEKIAALENLRRQGKIVTLLEYTRDRLKMARIRMKAAMHGFIPYFSVKELDRVFRDLP